MNEESMRDEFQAWARDNAMLLFVKTDTGKYSSEKTELAWQAWQASRAALVITLPCELKAESISDRGAGFNTGRAFCKALIRDAGVRVKE